MARGRFPRHSLSCCPLQGLSKRQLTVQSKLQSLPDACQSLPCHSYKSEPSPALQEEWSTCALDKHGGFGILLPHLPNFLSFIRCQKPGFTCSAATGAALLEHNLRHSTPTQRPAIAFRQHRHFRLLCPHWYATKYRPLETRALHWGFRLVPLLLRNILLTGYM